MTYTLPKLDYGYDALEPVIDKETMQIHHTKHHQAYVDKLNAALGNEAQDSLEEVLLTNVTSAVQNNGGGHFNHSFFWKILAPGGSGKPNADLMALINKCFGSYEKFVEEFTNTALTRFGSGWAWLSLDKSTGQLEIYSMVNQDHPKLNTHVPLLGLDVWEHAYYLKYQNRRPEYVKAFFSIINWDRVNHLFTEASSWVGKGSS